MPPLMCDVSATQKAVFLVTIPIAFGRFKLSHNAYSLLARHVGMSMDAVSHWAIAVIDRTLAPSYFYELMSDDLALNALMRNQFRFEEITSEYITSWTSCYYIGETTQSHEQILQLGHHHLTLHPRYKLLDDNCQDMVEVLVKHLCDGKVISQAKLREELSLASPKIALDLMMAKFRSRMDTFDDHEDSEKVKNENAEVNEDVNIINSLWQKIHR
ncbi:hypothetical protein BKA67DRAFT_557072 [Truncatella angustata]|uniref:PPPDE domain-containing protein n=1 Tax=Truncatella angustata TaxID=152316 RepID=A0A9P8UU61_9PEZI|nr:uncharacterized protein BKA67DRAFT_557072 [Truncatella angustata]KAH6658065.1 hypothetical protein BKA67DRAFT_557072 [Truncatella angustata]